MPILFSLRNDRIYVCRSASAQRFKSHKMHTKITLAATNTQIVDDWNKLNSAKNESKLFWSSRCANMHDDFQFWCPKRRDDPNDAIFSSRMLTTEMLNRRRFNSDNKSLTTHLRKLLCVGDICYLMRTLGRETESQQIVQILELRKVRWN